MAQSANIACELREELGSRPSRKLRGQGRTIASVQVGGEQPHLDIHMDEVEFLTLRRQHTHLYDLDVGAESHSAVIRELQWDAMGDQILHVEFKRVTRGVATQSEIEVRPYGHVSDGLLTILHTHIAVSCIPSLIPDGIEMDVNNLETGARIFARDLVLPEGVELAVDLDLEVAVVSGQTEQAEEVQPAEDAAGEPEAGDAPAPEGGEG